MQHKIRQLLIIFVVLFSLQGFSQTTEKSAHPLLDKYYPQKQSAPASTVEAAPAEPVSPVNPVTATKQITNTKTVTAVTDTTTIEKPLKTTVSVSPTKIISETKPAPVVTDSIALNKLVKTPLAEPVPKKNQPKPAGNPYMDTRLGSSSPLYDTYEKNNNGAGSVTTGAK